jgi:hypothetical protein
MKVNLVAATFEHGTAQIVVQKDSRLARPSVKRADMPAQKVFHALIEEEFQIQSARVGKDDQEARQTPTSPTDGDFAEVGPVNLSLFSRKSTKSQEGFLANWPQAGHQASQLHDTSGITAISDHVVDARGTQPGIVL